MKRQLVIYYSCVMLFVAFGCGKEAEQHSLQNEMEQASKESQEVREFVQEAASQGMMEIRMAEIAIERSQNPEIELLAQTIKTDHQKAGDELRYVATQKRFSLPLMLIDTHAKRIDALVKTKWEQIDEAYLKTMVDAHEDAIASFEKCAHRCNDREVIDWANKHLPILRMHVDRTRDLQNKVAVAEEQGLFSMAEEK